MTLIIKFFSLLIIIAGGVLLISPGQIIEYLRDNVQEDWFYWIAIAFRFILGSLLVISAKSSKLPLFVKAIGLLSLTAAIFFLFMGQQWLVDFVSSFFPYMDDYAPLSGFFAIVMGIFLLYAYTGTAPRNEEEL